MHFWRSTNEPLLYAHRGANREFPENSVEAFRRAIELGADVLELDIHATRDGAFVVSHDPSGERCAGVPQRIAECTWAEVGRWDAGWGFADGSGAHPYRGRGIRHVDLAGLLELFPATPLNVDVKQANRVQIQQLVRLIERANAADRVLLTSFSSQTVRIIAQSGYRGAIGLSKWDVVRLFLGPERLNQWWGFRGCRVQIPTSSGPFLLRQRQFIERCHRLGLGVDFWVVNDAGTAAELLALGADGIVTDEPGPMAKLIRRACGAGTEQSQHLECRL